MRPILVLLRKDFVHFIRDRGSVILTFVVPLALIYLFGQIYGLHRPSASGMHARNPIAVGLVAGWAMQFLLFALVWSANSLFQEKDRGIFQRILSGPVPRSAILWSKFLYGVCFGLLQLLILFTTGHFLFGLELLHHLPLLLLACLAAAAACSAFGMLLAAVSTTVEMARGLSTFAILMMSALGGAWFPVGMMPPFLQHLSRLTLVYWSIDAFGQVLLRNASLLQLLPTLGIVTGIAATFLAVAWWRFARGRIFE